MLFPYQTNFWSEIAPASLRPRYFHAVETDQKETVTTTVRHATSRVESVEVTKQHNTGKTKRTDRSFGFVPVFDIFSAMLLVRSQKLATGDPATLWLSDDADRIPVEFRAAAFIGDVRATLAAHRKP